MLTWLEINQQALIHNINQIKKLLRETDKLAPVIKSNAYGHGLIEIAQLLDHDPSVAFFCCSSLSEAAQLRAGSIKKPIIVLGIFDDNPATFDDRIELALFDLTTAYYLNDLGRIYQRFFRVHIKIDTGLGRFGFMPDELGHVCAIIKQLPFLQITGMYTHFADAQSDDSSYTFAQMDQFDKAVKECTKAGLNPQWIHAANSAATLSYDFPSCNLFRIGLSMYGYWPSASIKKKALQKDSSLDLLPILSWKTRIIHIKEVPANTCIGYKRTFKTTRHTILGTLPVGYFDGYDFRFSNTALVQINNTYAPIVGRICMNLCIIDLTDIGSVPIGTSVTLLGPLPEINAYTLSAHLGQDNVRPLLSSIATHVPRIITHTLYTQPVIFSDVKSS